MSRTGKIARRSFLFGSLAIAGGVAFGIYTVRRPHPNPLADDLDAGEATFNPWVRIGPDGITLITPHADIGQGATHMQATLIAEEMDLDYGQFRTDFGPPAPAYYNTAMAAEAVPAGDGIAGEMMETAVSAMFKVMGMQATGGSSAVPDSFDKLREAGAIARETLRRAAAERTGVAVSELRTRSGAVHLPDGTALPYTELAEAAATLEPVRDVTLRDPSEWRLIGQPTRRLDIVAKSTGRQTFGIDLAFEGMVHAAVRISPRRSAVAGYDDSAARDMRGVSEIVPVTNGLAVVADNTWRAFRAAAALDIDWAEAPYPAEQAGHWDAVAASFTDDRLDRTWRDAGDSDAALDGADTVIKAEYRAPYLAHQPMEPLSAIVRVTDDAVEVWTAHQFPRFLQRQVAAVTGHDADQVILHNQFAGGSFGHRLEFDNVTLCAEIANRRRGTPVKLTFSREEDFAQDYLRQIGMARGRGTVRDGRVETYDLQVATVSASRSQFGRVGLSMPGPDAQIAAGVAAAPFTFDNHRVRAYAVPELAPSSSWRSVGASTAGFFGEAFLDELIHAAGADPLEERLRTCTDPVARRVLEAVAEMSDWGTSLGAGRGRGLAMVTSFGVPVAEVVEVSDTAAGLRIDRVHVAADVGRIVDPVNFENHVQGAVVWALGHAMNCEITFTDGRPVQDNFHVYEGMRIHQCPEINVRGLETGPRVLGIGEPPVPPAAPALANAIFAATGTRLREMPFDKSVKFA